MNVGLKPLYMYIWMYYYKVQVDWLIDRGRKEMLSGNFRGKGVCGTSLVIRVWMSSMIHYNMVQYRGYA